MDTLTKSEVIDVSGFDRVLALIVAENDIYVSDCDHQDALEMLCNRLSKKSGIDWNSDFDTAHKKAVALTDQLFLEDKIQGFSIYEGTENKLYLLSHYPENLKTAYPVIQKYAKEHGCIIGTFFDRSYKAQLYA